jgi:hypothetical protein
MIRSVLFWPWQQSCHFRSPPAAVRQRPRQTLLSPVSSEKAQRALDKITGQVLSEGPNGEMPSPVSVADLTPEEIDKASGLNAQSSDRDALRRQQLGHGQSEGT